MQACFKSKNISFRAIEPKDAELLFCWENDTTAWSSGDNLNPVSKAFIQNYVTTSHRSLFDEGYLRLIILENSGKTAIGNISLYDYDAFHKRVSLGIYIDSSYRQHGYGKEALQMLSSYVLDKLRLHQLYAFVSDINTPAKSLFISAGFKATAVLPQWIWADGEYQSINVFQLWKE